MSGGIASKESSGVRSPFMAFISDDVGMETAVKFAEKMLWPASCIHKGNIYTATDTLRGQPSPQVLMVEIPSHQEAAEALDKLADVCDPGVKVIVTGTINEYSFYIWLTEIGISSYVLKPFTVEVLDAHYQKTVTPAAPAAVETKPLSKSVAFIGARGGVGSTTIAANVAHIIGTEIKKPTVLVDLDAQFGTASMALDLEPTRGLRDALEKPDRVDSLFIERVLVRVSKELAVLSSEEPLVEDIQPKEQAAGALIKELCTKYQYVIVDVPRVLTPLTRSMLKQVDKIVLVAELNLLSLRDTLRIADYLKDSLKVPPAMLIISKTGFSPKFEMSRTEFEKSVGMKIEHSVPFGVEVMQAMADGKSLLETSKSSAVTHALIDIARSICPDSLSAGGKPAAGTKKPLFSFKGGKK